MTELKTLEAQLAEALGRIARAGTALSDTTGQGDSAEVARLQAALEAATSRAEALETAAAQTRARFEAALQDQQTAMTDLDAELQRLRAVTQRLAENNAALRAACEANAVEPALLNQSMIAELEALRAERAAETREVQTVMAALNPLLTEKETA